MFLRLESAAKHIAGLLNQSLNPALLVDMEVDCSGITETLSCLVNKRKIPYAALRTGKALLSEVHPLFKSVYMGEASAQPVKDIIKPSDCLIVTEPCFMEGSPMVFPGGLPIEAHVYIRGYNVTVENGTSNIALTDVRLPEGTRYISQLIWGAIGHSLPALLGSMTSEPDRRHILFIGDGQN